jgi:hypothetical protein
MPHHAYLLLCLQDCSQHPPTHALLTRVRVEGTHLVFRAFLDTFGHFGSWFKLSAMHLDMAIRISSSFDVVGCGIVLLSFMTAL